MSTEIATLLAGYKIPEPVKKRRTERGDLLEYFHERLNASRKAAGYREIPLTRLAYMLSVFSVTDLYFLRMKCDTAQEWSKCFGHYVFANKNTH